MHSLHTYSNRNIPVIEIICRMALRTHRSIGSYSEMDFVSNVDIKIDWQPLLVKHSFQKQVMCILCTCSIKRIH